MSTDFRNIARVVRPHGTKGEVIVAELRGLPFYLHEGMEVALTPPALDRDRFCLVEEVKNCGGEMLVSFSCAHSLHDAESISGTTVLACTEDLDASRLDASVDELIGRAVVDARFGSLGVIGEVMLTPANDVWVVDGARYGEVLVPVIEQVVESVPAEGPIAVRLMDGLIDPSLL